METMMKDWRTVSCYECGQERSSYIATYREDARFNDSLRALGWVMTRDGWLCSNCKKEVES